MATPTIRLRFKSPFTYLYLSASVMAELSFAKNLVIRANNFFRFIRFHD